MSIKANMHTTKERLELGLGYCSYCKKELPKSNFYNSKVGTNGLFAYCKPCCPIKGKEYAARKREEKKALLALMPAQDVHYKACLHCGKPFFRNKHIGFSQFSKQRLCKRGCPMPKEMREAQDIKNAERNKLYSLIYKARPEVVERSKRQANEWYHRVKNERKHLWAWRWVLASAHKRMGTKKSDTTIRELRYSSTMLKQHLETLFLPGMSWENHGTWHIDHILPVSSFSPETPTWVVNALENLQPLWAADNIRKSNKY